jgi:hypothetical protein
MSPQICIILFSAIQTKVDVWRMCIVDCYCALVSINLVSILKAILLNSIKRHRIHMPRCDIICFNHLHSIISIAFFRSYLSSTISAITIIFHWWFHVLAILLIMVIETLSGIRHYHIWPPVLRQFGASFRFL